MNYYFGVLKKYAVFNGRARRKEYWLFFLFNFIITFILGAIDGSWSTGHAKTLSVIYCLAVLIPGIAVGVRRMHDINNSGWLILIPFFNLILFCTEGTKGANRYGPDLKEAMVN